MRRIPLRRRDGSVRAYALVDDGMTHPLIEKYGDPLPLLTGEPQSATDLYYRWAETPQWKSLNRRRRKERLWLGQHLQHLASKGVIQHGTVTTEHGGEWRGFWRVG